jgi:hypothetical protein
MRNIGQEAHHAQIVRLNTGVTLDQFTAALRQGEGPALALVSLAGGTERLTPARKRAGDPDVASPAPTLCCAS